MFVSHFVCESNKPTMLPLLRCLSKTTRSSSATFADLSVVSTYRSICSAVYAETTTNTTSSSSSRNNNSNGNSNRSRPHLDHVVRRSGVKADIIDGKRLAEKIHGEIASEVHDIVSRGNRPPNLTVVLVGEDPASKTYVRSKSQSAVKVGMTGNVINLPASITQVELLELIDQLNKDIDVDGLLVQLPLPGHIDEKTICQAVDQWKDVDGFHLNNIGRYCLGQPAFIPATPLGVLEILKRCHVEMFGKTACIVGRSKNIGFTLSALLHSDGYGSGNPMIGADCTTIICHRYTPPDKLERMTQQADIVITATGKPGLIRGNMIKKGATVIDIGITRVYDDNGRSKLVGDVDFAEVADVASLITPVPGGVGPMTVAMVLQNTMNAAKKIYQDSKLKPSWHGNDKLEE